MIPATDSISQLLASYVRFRTAVLRLMNFEAMTKAEFHRVSGAPSSSQQRRQLNPGLWPPADIHRFAYRLGLWDGENHRLAGLVDCIEQLPGQEKEELLGVLKLPADQLARRRASPDSWVAGEIARLLVYVNRRQ